MSNTTLAILATSLCTFGFGAFVGVALAWRRETRHRRRVARVRVLLDTLHPPCWVDGRALSAADKKRGTVYLLLAAMEEAGWIDSRSAAPNPLFPARLRGREYMLTDRGVLARDALASHAKTEKYAVAAADL